MVISDFVLIGRQETSAYELLFSGPWLFRFAYVYGMVFAIYPPLEAEEVLQLASEARAKLLDWVIACLNVDRARDVAWDALAAERDAELESGQAVAVPVEQTLARLRAEPE